MSEIEVYLDGNYKLSTFFYWHCLQFANVIYVDYYTLFLISSLCFLHQNQ